MSIALAFIIAGVASLLATAWTHDDKTPAPGILISALCIVVGMTIFITLAAAKP